MLEGERGDGEWVRTVEEVPTSGRDVREEANYCQRLSEAAKGEKGGSG